MSEATVDWSEDEDGAAFRFEVEWSVGRRPRIEDFLAAVSEVLRPDLLPDLLAIEIERRRSLGDLVHPEEYLERFPRHEEAIRRCFEAAPAVRTPGSARVDQPDGKAPAVDDETVDRLIAGPDETAFVLPKGGDPGRTAAAGPETSGADSSFLNDLPGAAETIGRYVVIRTLGRGAFGEVFLAYDPQLDRYVAIKVPLSDQLESELQVEQYLAEARVLAQLDDPGIVHVYDAGRTEWGGCYCVSQYVEGSDLADFVRRGRPATAEAAAIVARSAEALHHAHERGLVHRDIKPANILIDAGGLPHVADFGLALREQDFGKGAGFAGTPAYMSPEQARGEGHRVDRRSDVYSLGAVLYELMTGERAARGENLRELLDRICRDDPTPPRQIDPSIPVELERICLKAMARRASDRYATSRHLAEDLRHWERARSRAGYDGGEGPDAGETRIAPLGLRPFGADDAATYPELIPGPRGRDGLPDALRFWKDRLEENDEEATFRVGLLLGPSGCGKSSLVRAGVLPRLASHVIPIYAEATFEETEATLLRAIRKRYPRLTGASDLAEALASLRRGQGPPPGRKVVLVVDQFEQWLFAQGDERDSPLIEALRQCDGGRVQCLLLARDDYALAATAFMDAVEVPIVQGANFAALGLFDPGHARGVLARFGRALGRLPLDPGRMTEAQGRFLDRAVAGLAQGDRVVPVRIALFAEMAKERPWTLATLDAIGGAEGLGAAFLDEQLGASAANPSHRLISGSARAVLDALLPRSASDLKGNRRSRAELAEIAGLSADPERLDDLLNVLDGELRLITPSRSDPGEGTVATAPVPADDLIYDLAPSADAAEAGPARPDDCYQLAHDHWVPILREWLGKLKRSTPEGRAAVILAERAALWSDQPQVRLLPSWGEWIRIRRRTSSRDWTERQRRMMRSADRWHLAATTLAVGLLGLLASGAWGYVKLGRERRELARILAAAELRTRVRDQRLYAALLDEAQEASAGSPERTNRLLDAIDPALRGWEWRHLSWNVRTRARPAGHDSGRPADVEPSSIHGRIEATDGVTLLAIRDGDGVRIRTDVDDPRDGARLQLNSAYPLSAAVFAPDGSRLAIVRPVPESAGQGGGPWDVGVWDLATRERIWSARSSVPESGRAIVFSPDSRSVLIRPELTVREAATGRPGRPLVEVGDPGFNPGRKVTCRFDFTEQRFVQGRAALLVAADAFSGKELSSVTGFSENSLPQIYTANDAPRVLGVGRSGAPITGDRSAIPTLQVVPPSFDEVGDGKVPLTVWDVGRGVALWSDRRPYPSFPSVAFGPAAKRVALWGHGQRVYVLEVDTGQVVADLDIQPAGPGAVAFHPVAQTLAVVEGSGLTRVWDLREAKAILELDGPSRAVAYSRDGSRIVTTGDGRFATFWDNETGTRLYAIPGGGGERLGFNEDGCWLRSDKGARYAPHP